ncbi:unnamed protein product [Closterium sp. Yama58-4]|nr:unnamed protein product [Closterium sp. Yama58-4]
MLTAPPDTACLSPYAHCTAEKWRDLDVCQEFSISEILQATDNWSSDNVLGKGGFATVYKGVSRRGELLAVKRVELMSNEFENEVRRWAGHFTEWASSKVQAYEFASLKDPKLDAPEEAVVELADIALDCVKVPGCRRPDMKDVARRLHAILTKYCADGPSSSSADPAVHVEEERPSFGGGISMETFERSELSEGPSEWPTSRILSSSLSSKWWSFQQVGL